MGHADHRDDAGGGAGAAGQPLDLTQVVHAHLHHGVPGVVIQAEQGVGHTDVVVLVALGLEGFAKGGEDGVAELFGGGLAHTAGNADHLGAEQHAVVGGHADHGAGAVRHDDSAVLGHAVHGMVGDDISGAVPVSTGGEGMAVDALTGEADEHAAGLDLAAVGNNSVDVRRLGQSQASQQFVGRNGLHGIASLFYGYEGCVVVIALVFPRRAFLPPGFLPPEFRQYPRCRPIPSSGSRWCRRRRWSLRLCFGILPGRSCRPRTGR